MDAYFISEDSYQKVKILTAIKKDESNRNKYYKKSLWIKYTCRIITNKKSMPKNKNKQKKTKYCVFIKHHTKLN